MFTEENVQFLLDKLIIWQIKLADLYKYLLKKTIYGKIIKKVQN